MSDQDTSPEQTTLQIRRVYLKEASLEQPNSPAILLEEQVPEVDIQMGVDAEPLSDDTYEVAVRVTVHAKIAEKTVFLVEAKQAGIFQIANFAQDQMGMVLGIACPHIVYPYLRSNVADLIQRAGFPPVNLAEINFQAMYERQMAAEAANADAQPAIQH